MVSEQPRVLVHLAPFETKAFGFTKSTFFIAGVYISELIVNIDPVTVIYIYCDEIRTKLDFALCIFKDRN